MFLAGDALAAISRESKDEGEKPLHTNANRLLT